MTNKVDFLSVVQPLPSQKQVLTVILYLIDTSSPMNQALAKDYVESFKQYLQWHLTSGDAYLVFDRYIKSYKSSPSQRLC